MNNKRKIESIVIIEFGTVIASDSHPIELFTKNGEMAAVDWYRCGKREINSKYVSVINYE